MGQLGSTCTAPTVLVEGLQPQPLRPLVLVQVQQHLLLQLVLPIARVVISRGGVSQIGYADHTDCHQFVF
jgi:hypothetical protein